MRCAAKTILFSAVASLMAATTAVAATAQPSTGAQLHAQTPVSMAPNYNNVNVVLPSKQPSVSISSPIARTPRPKMRDYVYAGSLKANVIRLAREHGWRRVVWQDANDYRWVGTTRITSQSLTGLLGNILQNYPLQAVFYRGNHVLVIMPRTLR